MQPASRNAMGLTQAGRKEHDVQIGRKLLHFRVEHALTSHNIPRQADAYNLQDSLEDQ